MIFWRTSRPSLRLGRRKFIPFNRRPFTPQEVTLVDRVKLLSNLNEFLRHPAEPDERVSEHAIQTCIHTLTTMLWSLGYDRLLVHRTLLARGFAGIVGIAGPDAAAAVLDAAAAVLDELKKGLSNGD